MTIPDKELFALCKKWGSKALEARRKFIGLLPEVYKRELFRKRGYTSIYHFAAMMGGVGSGLVDEVLRLEKKFEDKPTLHLALVEGEIGLSKLSRIASVATASNENELCEKVRHLSKRAVDVLVKEISLPGQTENPHQQAKNYDYEILAALSPEAKAKIKELLDKNIDINTIILNAFSKREEQIAEQKAAMSQQTEEATSRYIKIQPRRLLKQEFGDKCAVPNCPNRAEHIHHEKHFAVHRTHDVRYLKPLCRGHHELAHAR